MKQQDMADELRRTSNALREAGADKEVWEGNLSIAEYIEGLECGLAAERKLSVIRTDERDALKAELTEAVELLGECEELSGVQRRLRIADFLSKHDKGGPA